MLAIELDLPTWAAILAGKATLRDAMADGRVRAVGDRDRVPDWFGCFDHPALAG